MTKLSKILKKKNIKHIKYFHPSGNTMMPSGHHIQLGGFLKECRDNTNSFIINNNQILISMNYTFSKEEHPTQFRLSDSNGGIIVFPTDVRYSDSYISELEDWIVRKINTYKNRWFSKSRIINKHNNSNEDFIGSISLGCFFNGRYIGNNGELFNEKSLSLELVGINSKGLITIAELIVNELSQETVLVNDLDENKIYAVNSENHFL